MTRCTGTEVAFEGIRRRFKLHGLTSDALTTLAAGEILQDEFDIAATHGLSRNGWVTLRSSGLVPLVREGSVSGYFPYRSNTLQVEVDTGKVSQISKSIKPLDRRTQETCTDLNRMTTLNQALNNTASLANAAAQAALSGSVSKFTEYFKTTANSTRQVVAARLQAVAKEAQSSSSGGSKYFCTDVYGYCEPNVLAYTLPALNVIANCDIYYSYLPALADHCHGQDQATTSLHEFTHAPGVYSPGTEDFAYGYAASTSLNTSQAVMNADSYALFANGELGLSRKCSRNLKLITN